MEAIMKVLAPFIPNENLPKGYDNILRYYNFTENDYVVDNGKVQIKQAWAANNLVKLNLKDFPNFPAYVDPRIPVTSMYMNKNVVDAFTKVWEKLNETGFVKFLTSYAGCYNPRFNTGSNKYLSLHTLGIAIDFNSRLNGYGLAPDKMEMRAEVVRIFEEFGWCWGGRWTPTDGMHFQYTQPYDGSNWHIEPIHYEGQSKYTIEKLGIKKIKFYNISNSDMLAMLESFMYGIKTSALASKEFDFGVQGDFKISIEDDLLHIRRV